MASIIGGIACSHTPTIGFAHDKHGSDDPVWGPIFAAFAPDAGQSVNTLLGELEADAPQPPILPPVDGFLFLDRDKFAAS